MKLPHLFSTLSFSFLALLSLRAEVTPASTNESTNASSSTLREASPTVVNPPTRSSLQQVLSLDGSWNFTTDPKKEGMTQEWFRPGAVWQAERSLVVPGCWEAQGVGTEGEHNLLSPLNRQHLYVEAGMKTEYEGVAWYRKEIEIPADWSGKEIWLKVGGVNCLGEAFINGTAAADLGGAGKYCGTYKYRITDLVKPGTKNLVVFMVRNDVASSKGARNIAARYGGIDGSVELEATPAIFVDYADVLSDAAKQTATVNLTLRHVVATPQESTSCQAHIVVRDQQGKVVGQTGEVPVSWQGEVGEQHITIPLSPCALWSPEHPALHDAEITISSNGHPLYGWVERFGVANWTVQGTDILLNGKKFFVRGIGFDADWPITINYPLDRKTLHEFFARLKSYGFNHIRHWAHTPPPEYCEAAAEEGICFTVELPYYHDNPDARQGHHWDSLPKEYDIPQHDLEEVTTQYRRFPSIFTFSGGNEGSLHGDRKKFLETVHTIAPGKLWTLNTGHVNNRPGVSDYNIDYFSRQGGKGEVQPGNLPNFPHILHEYSNPSYMLDPRAADRYTTGYLSPIPLEKYKQHVADAGLEWTVAESLFDASQEMTAYYQKLAGENARTFSEPPLCGYHMWGSINGDSHFFAQQDAGMLDAFFGQKKGGSPEFYHQFNQPVVLLSKITPSGVPFQMSLTNPHGGRKPKVETIPEQVIFTTGQTIDIDLWLSNFSENDLSGKLEWSICDGDKVLKQQIVNCSVPQGGVLSVNKMSWTIPALTEATRLTVTAKLQGTDTANSWDIWAFPPPEHYTQKLSGVAATPKVFAAIQARYPGLIQVDASKPLSDDIKLLITEDLNAVQPACDQGKKVLLLNLHGLTTFSPGVHGGEWGPNLQEGTFIAHTNPIFAHFPCKDLLEPVFSHLMGDAALMTAPYKTVTPIMVGAGNVPGYKGKTLPDYLLEIFEAPVSKGYLLATGLNLLNNTPEAACLLDGMIRYANSDAFHPDPSKGLFEIKEARSVSQNGFAKILQSPAEDQRELFTGMKKLSVAQSEHPEKSLLWESKPVQLAPNATAYDIICFVGMGSLDANPASFILTLAGKPIAKIPVSLEGSSWHESNGVSLKYQVKETATQIVHSTIFADMEKAMGTGKKSTEWESSGILRITVPKELVTPGQPLSLGLTPNPSAGKAWMGLIVQ